MCLFEYSSAKFLYYFNLYFLMSDCERDCQYYYSRNCQNSNLTMIQLLCSGVPKSFQEGEDRATILEFQKSTKVCLSKLIIL